MDTEIANELRKSLLNVFQTASIGGSGDVNGALNEVDDSLKKATNTIFSVLKCTECSLWSINSNKTKVDGNPRSEILLSTSLIHREISINYEFKYDEDYVHTLKTSFFEEGIEKAKENKSYYFRCNQADAIKQYRSKDFIESNNIKDFIVIPIHKKAEYDEIIAIIEISYTETCDYDSHTWNEISLIVQGFFSAFLQNDLLIKKQKLLQSLIDTHDRYRFEGSERLFCEILSSLLDFCKSQGASFFIWNSYRNRYKLVATTGMDKSLSFAEVNYEIGEGLTGKIGKYHLPFITDNIKKEEHNKHKGKYRENLAKPAKTAMFIPITRPTDEQDVIGILRFINKKNGYNQNCIDFYNDNDVDIMMFVSKYLSFVIDSSIKEDEQIDFCARLAHEVLSPANAIRKSADRVLKNYLNKKFQKNSLQLYLQDIVDLSEFQIWQATTNMFLWRRYRDKTLKRGYDIYDIKEYSLYEILEKSKELVSSVARNNGVEVKNIYIEDVPKNYFLRVDLNAFITLFYNLFTNAIKYHSQLEPDSFYVRIACFSVEKKLIITVEDRGIGFIEKDKDQIFKIGYRGENAIRVSASGMGVGLPVIRQIVEDFNGSISITHLRNPTIIKIELPIKLLSYE